MGSYFYRQALNGESCLWACVYGLETTPTYHKCDECPDFSICDLDWKRAFLMRRLLEQINGGENHE